MFLEATQGKVSESLFLFIALFEAVKHMNFHEPMTVNVGWPPTCSNKTIFENEIEIEVVALHIQKNVIYLLHFLQIKSGVLNLYIIMYLKIGSELFYAKKNTHLQNSLDFFPTKIISFINFYYNL